MPAASPTPSSAVSPAAAAHELLARRRARAGLIGFTEYTFPSYRAAGHHRLIAAKLEAVARGEIDRLMIFMPPRHGKSELASRRFPAWFLGRHRSRSVIAGSYNADLATDFGREVRNIVGSPAYATLFDLELAADSRAANRWHTDAGGAYVAAGVDTAVTGRGADVFLIDDPLKDRAEADSQVARDRVWRWYTSTVYTRLDGDLIDDATDVAGEGTGGFAGAIVLIQTRWHEDDLAGRLLTAQDQGGDRWDVVELPALDQGRALWPQKFPAARLERIRAAIGAREWSALYQQRPAPADGIYFKRAWLRWYDAPPPRATLQVYGASDYAVTADGGDYTVHGVAGLDADDNLFLLDWARLQADTDVWVDVLLDLAQSWRPVGWAEETGQIEKSVGPFIDKRMRERRVYFAREGFASARDKPTRAQAIRGRFAQGKVYLPRHAPWTADLVAELLAFNAGKHDDQVDVLSLFGRMLDRMAPGRRPRPAGPPHDDWGFEDEAGGESWKTV